MAAGPGPKSRSGLRPDGMTTTACRQENRRLRWSGDYLGSGSGVEMQHYAVPASRSRVPKSFGLRGLLGENATEHAFCCASKQLHQGFLGGFGGLAVARTHVLHGRIDGPVPKCLPYQGEVDVACDQV